MYKNVRCYGRKKTTVLKEKSFIRNFFDGNESSDISLSSGRRLHEYSFNENKENNPNILCSPALFQNGFHKDSTEGKQSVENDSFCTKKRVKAGPAVKRNKPVRGYRNIRKNPKQIHFSTKYCKSHQPRWSQFYNHEFTIEKAGAKKHSVCTNMGHGNKTDGRSTLRCIKSTERSTGLSENINKINVVQNNNLSSNTDSVSNNFNNRNSKKFQSQDTLNSSGELFLPINKKKKIVEKKKIAKKKKYVNESEENSCKLNQKVNVKSTTTELKNINDPSMRLDNLLGSFIRTESTSNICFNNVQEGNLRNIASETSLNLLHGSLDKQITAHKWSTDMSVIQNVEKSGPQNNKFGMAIDFSEHGNILNLDTDSPFHTKNKSSDLFLQSSNNKKKSQHVNDVQNIHDHIQNYDEIVNISNHSDDISEERWTKNDLIKTKSHSKALLSKISREQKECVSENNFNNSKISYGNSRPSTSSVQSLPSGSLLVENYFQSKECLGNDQQSSISIVQDTKLKNNVSNAYTAHKSVESMQSETFSRSSFNDLKVSGISRKTKNSAGKFCYNEMNLVNFSPNVSNMFQYSDSIGKKLRSKFVTSTPVMKGSKNVVVSTNARLPSLLSNKNSPKIIASNNNAPILVTEKAVEADCLTHYSRTEKSLHNLQNSLISDPVRKLLQFTECSHLSSPKNCMTVQNKNSNTAVSSKRNRSLLNISSQNVSPSPGNSDEFTKTQLLKLCNQESVAEFADIYDWNNFKVNKIGEGSYGEVFMITKRKSSSVLKIIPVSENPDDNSYQGLQSVLSEVQISKCLSELRNNKKNNTKNFIKVNRASVVTGSYPIILLDAWDNFAETKSCYNERPDALGDNRIFVILELEYGGKDMSCFVLRNAVEAESILKQITLSLAIAEEEFLFEHRDLHLGNILVQRNRRKTISYKLRGKDISIDCHGVLVTVIDFTLSRLYKDGYMYFYDLAEDVSLFEQSGDCQFAVYKSMRKHLENQWQECSLYSNILWLKYLCQKMKESTYSRPSTAAHKKGLKAIENFNSCLMDCSCALETLKKCGITTFMFDKLSFDFDISKKSILVSRNSTKKKYNSTPESLNSGYITKNI